MIALNKPYRSQNRDATYSVHKLLVVEVLQGCNLLLSLCLRRLDCGSRPIRAMLPRDSVF